MTAPNMATLAASLERSMQNCSLNRDGTGADGGVGLSATSDEPDNLTNSHTAVELNSHVALPYHWEQCLDLKTGELFYIDWENGTKAKEDPRMKTTRACVGGGSVDFYTEEDSSYGYGGGDYGYGYDSDGEGSSSTSTPSPSPSREDHRYDQGDHVLVVAGCKRCFMYFMLPKQVAECPKCNGLILHFDRSENGSHEI